MKFYNPIRLSTLLTALQPGSYETLGDETIQISGIDDYRIALPHELTWVDFEPYYGEAFASPASVVILNTKPARYPENKVLVITADPKDAFDRIAEAFYANRLAPRTWWEKLWNPKNIVRGKNCRIHPSVAIGKNVYIGDNVTIEPHVTIHDNVYIGDNTTIHAGCVIGTKPFAYVNRQEDEHWEERKAWGDVIIMDHVDLLALSTVERGITGSTIIGSGTKTGCQVLISHDVWIGRDCYLCGNVSIGGYARMKDHCTLWACAALANSVHVADHTTVQSCGVVYQDVREPGKTYAGVPAIEADKYWENRAIENIIIKDYVRNQ